MIIIILFRYHRNSFGLEYRKICLSLTMTYPFPEITIFCNNYLTINFFMFLCFLFAEHEIWSFSHSWQPFVAYLWSLSWFFFTVFISIIVESNSSCLETYKITFQSRLYLVWLRRYDKKILAAILDFILNAQG